MKRGPVREHEVYMPGALLTIYRTRQDGLVRVEIKDYGTDITTTLYMTAEERERWADAFAGKPESARGYRFNHWRKRRENARTYAEK